MYNESPVEMSGRTLPVLSEVLMVFFGLIMSMVFVGIYWAPLIRFNHKTAVIALNVF
jgi:hypothetical protein